MASPTERILRLAAYADGRGTPVSLAAITVDVPGYEVDGPLVADTPEWETVRKRLQRDLADLRDHWGIHLHFDPDADGYVLAPPFLEREERTALIAAATIVDVEGVGVGEPGAIGSAVDDSAAQIVVRVHALVAALRGAIARHSTVSFAYDGATRRVEPWALGTWRNRWYLAANDCALGELRRFRLDRIEPGTPAIAVDDGVDAYVVPGDFDVDAAFDLDPNSWGHDPVLHARVRVERDHVDAFVAEMGGEVTARDADASVVELDVREYRSFRTRLLSFGGHAVVESPPELIELVMSHLRALAGSALMPALSKQREFEILRAVLALAEERGDGVALVDAARAVDIDAAKLRDLLAPVLFLAFHTSGGMVDESWAFLLTEDDRLIVSEDHWLRSLASAPPDPDAALRLLVAGLAMQSAASAPTPDLDRAVAKLREEVTDRLQVTVPTPPCLRAAQRARRDGRSLRVRYLTDHAATPTDREILPLRVFSKWGHWYVTGHDVGTTGEKQFRVDRMVSAEPGDVEFDPPPDTEIPDWFDLTASERTVRLRCTRRQLDAIPRPATITVVAELDDGSSGGAGDGAGDGSGSGSGDGRVEAGGAGDGRVEADVTISGDRRLDWVLVALDPSTEVVSPPEAVTRRRDHARALLERLGG